MIPRDKIMNPFSKNPTPSIFNENLVSKQDKIP